MKNYKSHNKISNLLDLPPELILTIVKYLDENSIIQIKRVCKKLHSLISKDQNFFSYAPHLAIIQGNYSIDIKNATIKTLLENEQTELRQVKVKLKSYLDEFRSKEFNLERLKECLESASVTSLNAKQFGRSNPKVTLAFFIALAIFVVYTPIATVEAKKLNLLFNETFKKFQSSPAYHNDYFQQWGWCDDLSPEYEACQKLEKLAVEYQGKCAAWAVVEALEILVLLIMLAVMSYKFKNRNTSLPSYLSLPVSDLKKDHARLWNKTKQEYGTFLRSDDIHTIQDVLDWINTMIKNEGALYELWKEGNKILKSCQELLQSTEAKLKSKNYEYTSTFNKIPKGKIFHDANTFFSNYRNKINDIKNASSEVNFKTNNMKLEVNQQIQMETIDDCAVDIPLDDDNEITPLNWNSSTLNK